MTVDEIRSKYLAFFEKQGHAIIDPAPLVLENDPTTLFTSSGMQPLVPYLMGETHPAGKRLVDSQPSIRVQDIEEVGDNRHTTFFEMLGNWSLGDYFKKEQLPWIFSFLTDKEDGLGLDSKKIYVSVFEGDSQVPRDEESIKLWQEIFKTDVDAMPGVDGFDPYTKIYLYPAKKNWWSRSGTPEQMPAGEIGGPDTEMFFDFGEEFHLHENSPWKDEPCHPNCDCGRFLEIGNSVFIQYKKLENGKLEELPQKNVDFGGGLERMAAALNNDPDVFTINVFQTLIKELEKLSGKTYGKDENETRAMRVIADHVRAASMLIRDGVVPSNKGQGYVLRRLIRRAVNKAYSLDSNFDSEQFRSLVPFLAKEYPTFFDDKTIETVGNEIAAEVIKFRKTLDKGLKEVGKITEIDGKIAFDLYQTYGFPLELSIEIFQEKGQQINVEEFKKAFEEHQNKSRTASAGVFKGGLMDHSAETTALHTATHLLHAALRQVLGTHVQQKGSNITHERLRFDFTHPTKITPEEIKKIEDLINEQIKKDLPVSFTMMSLDEADKKGALHFFDKKYEEQVKVYTVGDPDGEFFSKEVCGGPHVTHLSEINGHVTITKEEAVSAGVRRLYATITS